MLSISENFNSSFHIYFVSALYKNFNEKFFAAVSLRPALDSWLCGDGELVNEKLMN
jgi:hypothetical protein